LFDGCEPEVEPLVLHIVFELSMYAISETCGLTHVIFVFALHEVAYHPFTGVDMVSDEIQIVSDLLFVHVVFM